MRRIVMASSMVLAGLIVSLSMSRPVTAAKPLDGRDIFRFDTFRDEQLWTDTLRLHEAIATVSPATALAVGLKVDVDALPTSVTDALKAGKVPLNAPATTLALVKLNAVVGVKGHFKKSGTLSSVGITCALCHSTVNDSLAPGPTPPRRRPSIALCNWSAPPQKALSPKSSKRNVWRPSVTRDVASSVADAGCAIGALGFETALTLNSAPPASAHRPIRPPVRTALRRRLDCAIA